MFNPELPGYVVENARWPWGNHLPSLLKHSPSGTASIRWLSSNPASVELMEWSGESGDALDALDRALEHHDPALMGIGPEPLFDSLRSSVRFRNLMMGGRPGARQPGMPRPRRIYAASRWCGNRRRSRRSKIGIIEAGDSCPIERPL